MYVAHLLWGIAQALLPQNWIADLAMLASLLPLCLLRVPREERIGSPPLFHRRLSGARFVLDWHIISIVTHLRPS